MATSRALERRGVGWSGWRIMKVSLVTDALSKLRVDLLAIAVRQGNVAKDARVKQLDKSTRGAITAAIALDDFSGKSGDTLRVVVKGIGAKVVLLVGTGDAAPQDKDARLLAIRAVQAAGKYGSVGVALAEDASTDAISAAAEGCITGAYKYSRYLTGDRVPKTKLDKASIVVSKKTHAEKAALERGVALAEAICIARDLVNGPPNDVTPTALADAAKAAVDPYDVSTRIWDKKGLDKLGMNLFLAVNRGSAEEPRFVHMAYKPDGAKRRVVFVGKGLTFDSGGLCIKPPLGMLDMKCDMAGAAVTIGIMTAAARLKLPIEVHALFGATENMTGSAAYRPGDVFTSLEGKTVEIINTDAEGRLVLADVLAYAQKLEPDFLIDHATLTGACIVALGPWTAGLFANDDELATRYLEASKREGETFWRLPLDEELRDALKSEIADLKHTGDRNGGSITAALFLREFVGDTPWVHVDIAGPSMANKPYNVFAKGGTGHGVLTYLKLIDSFAGE